MKNTDKFPALKVSYSFSLKKYSERLGVYNVYN